MYPSTSCISLLLDLIKYHFGLELIIYLTKSESKDIWTHNFMSYFSIKQDSSFLN